jgi:predicted ATPase
MINRLSITHFKCIDQLEIGLAGITMLAGLNGMGKSTCIQSLLLLHQSALEQSYPFNQLVRNGRWISLGTPKDLLWEAAVDDRIRFALEFCTDQFGPERIAWNFLLDEKLNEFVGAMDPQGNLPDGLGIFSDRLYYLRADRMGPRTSFPVSNSEVRIHRQLGRDGEYAAHFLAEFGEEPVRNAALHHSGARSLQLRHQLEAWLGEISPGTRLYTEAHHSLDLVSLEYAFSTGRGETNRYRATNVGFGISYILPIIIAALAATEDSLILIENPEAHIHPQGQLQMGRLLALASLGRVQIVVETHSDHMLNGLRLSVHDRILAPNQLAMHYFQRVTEADSIRSKVVTPVIDNNGRIDVWPDGFFDESEKALRQLLLPPAKHECY